MLIQYKKIAKNIAFKGSNIKENHLLGGHQLFGNTQHSVLSIPFLFYAICLAKYILAHVISFFKFSKSNDICNMLINIQNDTKK